MGLSRHWSSVCVCGETWRGDTGQGSLTPDISLSQPCFFLSSPCIRMSLHWSLMTENALLFKSPPPPLVVCAPTPCQKAFSWHLLYASRGSVMERVFTYLHSLGLSRSCVLVLSLFSPSLPSSANQVDCAEALFQLPFVSLVWNRCVLCSVPLTPPPFLLHVEVLSVCLSSAPPLLSFPSGSASAG